MRELATVQLTLKTKSPEDQFQTVLYTALSKSEPLLHFFGAKKRLCFQVLFNPIEEQLNLPARLVGLAYRQGAQLKIIIHCKENTRWKIHSSASRYIMFLATCVGKDSGNFLWVLSNMRFLCTVVFVARRLNRIAGVITLNFDAQHRRNSAADCAINSESGAIYKGQ